MKTLTGSIRSIVPIVVNGNTVYVFTVMKAEREHMEWADEIYAAVFVADDSGKLSDLTLQLACLSIGSEVKVTIEDIDGEVPVAAAANPKLRLTVVGVEAASSSRRGAFLRDC
jgi:hypothetical protein